MTFMKTVYIVEGSSGMYDEFSTWLLRAFTSKEKAERYAAACVAEATRISEARTAVQDSLSDDVDADVWAAWQAIPPNLHDPEHRNGDERYAVLSLPVEAS